MPFITFLAYQKAVGMEKEQRETAEEQEKWRQQGLEWVKNNKGK